MAELLGTLQPEVAAIVLVLFALLGVFGWALYGLLYGARARLNRRIQQVAGKAVKAKAERVGGTLRRRSIQTRLKQVDESRKKEGRSALREQLMMAGLRIEVPHFLAGCLGLAVVTEAVYALTGLPGIGLVLAPPVVGFGLPKLTVSIMAKRRLGKFTGAFADAIDVVVRGIRSGLPLGECMNIIGREMGDPLGAEFRLIGEGQKLGLTLQDALARAVERMPTTEFRFFAIVLTIQQQTGGNLAETLAKLSDVLRSRKRMRDKVMAYASEAKSSAAIIGSLPLIVTGLLSVAAPDYIGVMFGTDTGHFLLGLGLTVMAIGTVVMHKMTNFDI
jgi:tight adherence protein B